MPSIFKLNAAFITNAGGFGAFFMLVREDVKSNGKNLATVLNDSVASEKAEDDASIYEEAKSFEFTRNCCE